MKFNCGYEHECKNKNCLKCKKNIKKITISLNQAEQTAIEDFAVSDLKLWIEENPKAVELTQDIMRSIMKKMFKEMKE